MKKIIIMGVLAILVIACNPKDEDDYFHNLAKAEEKAQSCDQTLIKAITYNDEKTIMKLENDEACHNAFSFLKKKSQFERNREREALEQKRAQEIALREQEITKLEQSIAQSLSDKSWQEVIGDYFEQDECQKPLLGLENHHCSAWKKLYETALIEGKKILSEKSFSTLNQQKSAFCGLDKRRGSACDVWIEASSERLAQELKDLDSLVDHKDHYCSSKSDSHICEAWKKSWSLQNQQVIGQLMKDDALFVKVYNQCFLWIDEIRKSGRVGTERARLEREIVNNAPCSQVVQAHYNRGMGRANFKRKIAL